MSKDEKRILAMDEMLRTAGDILLGERGLQKLIEQYGAVHITGSYALHLMTWRDLDIAIDAPGISVPEFFDLGKRITFST